MISKISFKGDVFLSGSTKSLVKQSELKSMKRYAQFKDCDVVVLNRDYYSNGKGKCETILIKKDNVTGQNNLFTKVFDFMHRKENFEDGVPVRLENI